MVRNFEHRTLKMVSTLDQICFSITIDISGEEHTEILIAESQYQGIVIGISKGVGVRIIL